MGFLDVFRRNSGQRVSITAINIKLHNHMHSIAGMEVREREFSVTIPFRNKTHTDMLTEAAAFKAEKAKPILVKGISIDEPFKLLSHEPNTPIEIKADQKVDFKLNLSAPSHNYTGPMTVSFISDNVETIHVEISKTILDAKGRSVEIETSSRILNVPKGQVFTEKVQLYKALSYRDSVKKIEVEAPFKFIGSEPKLPLRIDDTNSYILELQIQAPESPYAGPLVVKMS